jgi:hypothetical protein
MGVKMRGIGCEIVSKGDPRPVATFSDDEIKRLSKLEYKRWTAERSLAGWTFDRKKNDVTRKTPYLPDWNNLLNNIKDIDWDSVRNNLPDDIKDIDRDAVKNIPNVLELVGLKVVRKEIPNNKK